MANIVEIADISAPELDVYARLTQAQLRNRIEPEKGIFIAESPKVVLVHRQQCTVQVKNIPHIYSPGICPPLPYILHNQAAVPPAFHS